MAKTSQELRAELDALDKKIREQQSIQVKSAQEFGSAAVKRLEAAGVEEQRLRALSKEKFAEYAAANKDNRVDFLKAERQRLLAEEEALQREYGSGAGGKAFLTGKALENWEARVRLNAKDLSQNFKEIQAESGQGAAKGQTATAPFNGNFAPNNPGNGAVDTTQNLNQPVNAEQRNNLVNSQSGQTAALVNQAQDPTAANKQNLSLTQGSASKSESNFAEAGTNNSSDSVVGQNVTGKKNEYENQPRTGGVRVFQNRLHAYTSYTYRITLFLLKATNPK